VGSVERGHAEWRGAEGAKRRTMSAAGARKLMLRGRSDGGEGQSGEGVALL
jgi:hypothetical protein